MRLGESENSPQGFACESKYRKLCRSHYREEMTGHTTFCRMRNRLKQGGWVTSLTVGLLVLLTCQACSPARPKGVPDGAQFIPKGGPSWYYCETSRELDGSALYQCAYYNERGEPIRTGWYILIAEFDEAKRYPVVKSALNKWRVNWWKGNMLLLAFESQSHEYHGSVSGVSYTHEGQISFADKDCISLLGAQDFGALEKRIEVVSKSVDLSRLHSKFTDQYTEFTRERGEPMRRDRESPCLEHYYFLS